MRIMKKSMTVNKAASFRNGVDMPWTYFTLDLMDPTDGGTHATTDAQKKDARRRLMWTSESEDASSDYYKDNFPASIGSIKKDQYGNTMDTRGDHYAKAGCHVSQIKRLTKIGSAYVEEFINNPTFDDYKKWGWPLDYDKTTNQPLAD